FCVLRSVVGTVGVKLTVEAEVCIDTLKEKIPILEQFELDIQEDLDEEKREADQEESLEYTFKARKYMKLLEKSSEERQPNRQEQSGKVYCTDCGSEHATENCTKMASVEARRGFLQPDHRCFRLTRSRNSFQRARHSSGMAHKLPISVMPVFLLMLSITGHFNSTCSVPSSSRLHSRHVPLSLVPIRAPYSASSAWCPVLNLAKSRLAALHHFPSFRQSGCFFAHFSASDRLLTDDLGTENCITRLRPTSSCVCAPLNCSSTASLMDNFLRLIDVELGVQQQLEHEALVLGIYAGRGLVDDDERRVAQQSDGEAETPLVAARQLAGLLVAVLRQAEALHQPGRLLLRLGRVQAADIRVEEDVLGHGDSVEQRVVLRAVADGADCGSFPTGQPGAVLHVNLAGALRRGLLAGNHRHGGGLAGSVRAQQTEDLAGHRSEGDASHSVDSVGVNLLQLSHLQHVLGAPGSRQHPLCFFPCAFLHFAINVIRLGAAVQQFKRGCGWQDPEQKRHESLMVLSDEQYWGQKHCGQNAGCRDHGALSLCYNSDGADGQLVGHGSSEKHWQEGGKGYIQYKEKREKLNVEARAVVASGPDIPKNFKMVTSALLTEEAAVSVSLVDVVDNYDGLQSQHRLDVGLDPLGLGFAMRHLAPILLTSRPPEAVHERVQRRQKQAVAAAQDEVQVSQQQNEQQQSDYRPTSMLRLTTKLTMDTAARGGSSSSNSSMKAARLRQNSVKKMKRRAMAGAGKTPGHSSVRLRVADQGNDFVIIFEMDEALSAVDFWAANFDPVVIDASGTHDAGSGGRFSREGGAVHQYSGLRRRKVGSAIEDKMQSDRHKDDGNAPSLQLQQQQKQINELTDPIARSLLFKPSYSQMASTRPKRTAKSDALRRLGLDSDSDDALSSDESTVFESETESESMDPETDQSQDEAAAEWVEVAPGSDNSFDHDRVPEFRGFSTINPSIDLPENPDESMAEFLSIFLTEEFLTSLVTWTNERMWLSVREFQQESAETGEEELPAGLSALKPCCVAEMKKFLGMVLFMGINSKPTIRHYWSTDVMYRNPYFQQAESLPRWRFLQLLAYFRCYDCREFDINDPLCKVRPFLDLISRICRETYRPEQDVAIDETLILYKGRLLLKQYIPSKKAKYGIKLYCLTESTTGYLWNFLLHSVEAEHATFGAGLQCDELSMSERVVVELSRELLDRKASGTKVVYLLDTSMPAACTDVRRVRRGGQVDQIPKPTAVIQYNRNMGGVDRLDASVHLYHPNRKSYKWFQKVAFHLILTLVRNAWTLYKKCGGTAKFLTFLENSIKTLIRDSGPGRARPPTQVPAPMQANRPIHSPMRLPATEAQARPSKRCRMCSLKPDVPAKKTLEMQCSQAFLHSLRGRQIKQKKSSNRQATRNGHRMGSMKMQSIADGCKSRRPEQRHLPDCSQTLCKATCPTAPSNAMARAQPVTQLQLLLLHLPLLLCPQLVAVAEASIANTSAAFRGVRVCPPSNAPANLTGLQSERSCAVECAARPDCAAAAHSPAEAACRLADAAAFAAAWRSSDTCRSVVNAGRLAGGFAVAALSETTLAALLVFHNFLLGLPNLAGNRSFAASLGSGARLTDRGVWLSGQADSFIEIDTESGNLTKHLTYGSQFTYFAKYLRYWQPGQTMVFIQEFLSSSLSTSGGGWREFRSDSANNFSTPFISATFAANNKEAKSSKNYILPVTDAAPVFTAATFNGSSFDKLFFNDFFFNAFNSDSSGSFASDNNERLRLGKSRLTDDWNMRGFFICWGVAAGQLTAAQLAEINALKTPRCRILQSARTGLNGAGQVRSGLALPVGAGHLGAPHAADRAVAACATSEAFGEAPQLQAATAAGRVGRGGQVQVRSPERAVQVQPGLAVPRHPLPADARRRCSSPLGGAGALGAAAEHDAQRHEALLDEFLRQYGPYSGPRPSTQELPRPHRAQTQADWRQSRSAAGNCTSGFTAALEAAAAAAAVAAAAAAAAAGLVTDQAEESSPGFPEAVRKGGSRSRSSDFTASPDWPARLPRLSSRSRSSSASAWASAAADVRCCGRRRRFLPCCGRGAAAAGCCCSASVAASAGDGEGGTPLAAQDVQTDGAIAVDVGMVDSGAEGHLGRLERIVGGEVDGEEEHAAMVGALAGPHDGGLPVEQVITDWPG
uniref:DDE_Tnp_1_7 domain-containing protein n=1 Tax=Macrostomum lignano TaxID=282301 RepID=A0A1I8H3C2_9PLAT